MSHQKNLEPTTRQLEVLRVIDKLAKKLGRPASHQEIADELGLTRIGVRPHLGYLVEKGLIEQKPIVLKGKLTLTAKGRAKLPKLKATDK